MLSFNNSTIKAHLSHHGSFGGVVTACYDTCAEYVAFVNYAAVGSDFVITSFGVNPRVTEKEAHLAGDVINSLLEAEAHKLGIRRLLIVHPHQDTAEVIEEYKLQPFVMGFGVINQPIAYKN
jgi:hypothetical protein